MNSPAICNWDAPGADRYTGSVAAAIVAYGLPIDTQSALIAAFERREFTDTVVIDRDSIRGQRHDYSPDIRSMHFGGAGRICSSVTRAGWSAEHVETALVICAGDECIAWPAVCGNVFRLARRARADQAGVRPVVDVGVGDERVLLNANALATVDASPAIALPNDQAPSGDAWRGWSFIGSTTSNYAMVETPVLYFTPTFAPPVAAVPEPEVWALIAAGLALVAVARRTAA